MVKINLCEECSKKSKLKDSIDSCLIHTCNISINSVTILILLTNSITEFILVPLFLGITSVFCLKSLYNDVLEGIKNV